MVAVLVVAFGHIIRQLDASILISYLLHEDASSPIPQIVAACITGQATLLLPEALLVELTGRVAGKPCLRDRIKTDDVARLAEIRRDVAEVIPHIADPIPAVTRDPKDDYLLAYAVVGKADYLITGDKDLLLLRVDPGIHARAAALAEAQGKSLNAWAQEVMKDAIAAGN